MTGPSRHAPAVVLRQAESNDEDLLLDWANDPATRDASRKHAPIAAADHHRWLERLLAAPDEARVWIGEAEGGPIGVVRFERRAPAAVEVAITVAPEARGRGLARPLLDAGIAAAREAFGHVTILADVLPDNEASLALFSGAGFTPSASPTEAADAGPDEAGVISLDLR